MEEEKMNVEIKTSEVKQEIVKQNEGQGIPTSIGDVVNKKMDSYMSQGLQLAPDYNVQNAVISSYLIIAQDDKLKNCSPKSIANALVDMATLSLNASKKQCYFVPYNGQLQCQPSYFGKIMAIKRIKGVIDVRADVIYKGTEYELIADDYGNEDIKITKICPLEERLIENIVGAWAKVILEENVWGAKTYTCVMTMDQIKKSWGQGATKGQSPAHKNFGDEMAKKTVINRCCKNFVNSAKDQDILISTLNKTIEEEYEQPYKVNNNDTRVIDF